MNVFFINFLDDVIKKTRFPLAKIKNIMKMDDNVKLCQKNVYNLIGKATELFLQDLASNAYNITALNRRKTMNIILWSRYQKTTSIGK